MENIYVCVYIYICMHIYVCVYILYIYSHIVIVLCASKISAKQKCFVYIPPEVVDSEWLLTDSITSTTKYIVLESEPLMLHDTDPPLRHLSRIHFHLQVMNIFLLFDAILQE